MKERDLVRRDGLFIVEGKVTLGRLVDASRFGIESVFVSDSRIGPLTDTLSRLDDEIPVYAAPQEVMDHVAGFHLHRGVLAVARRGEDTTCDSLIAQFAAEPAATLLALVDLSNHDNVGACFRNAAALGAGGVLLDAGSCDPLYRKSIRVSAGTVLSLPFARSGTGAEMMATLQRHGFEVWALMPSGGEPLPDLTPPPHLALMLGAEGPGLPPALMAQARGVSIPMIAGVDSLNVATAGAIALAHAFTARRR